MDWNSCLAAFERHAHEWGLPLDKAKCVCCRYESRHTEQVWVIWFKVWEIIWEIFNNEDH